MHLISVLLTGFAALVFGAAWLIQRNKVNGLLFFIELCVLLSILTTTYWKIIFSGLSAAVAIALFIFVINKKRKIGKKL